MCCSLGSVDFKRQPIRTRYFSLASISFWSLTFPRDLTRKLNVVVLFSHQKKDRDKVKLSYFFVIFPGEEIICLNFHFFIQIFGRLRIDKKDPITDTKTYFASSFWKEMESIIIILIRTHIFSYIFFPLVYFCSPPKFELLTFLNKNQSHSTIIPRDSCLTNRCLNLLLVLIGWSRIILPTRWRPSRWKVFSVFTIDVCCSFEAFENVIVLLFKSTDQT